MSSAQVHPIAFVEIGLGLVNVEVVRRAGDGLSEPVLESIARFAAQDLRLALMLVEASRQGGEFRDLPIQDGEEVWKRVTHLFRDRLGNGRKVAILILEFFDKVGVTTRCGDARRVRRDRVEMFRA